MDDNIDNQEEANVNNELFKGVIFCLCEDINDFDKIKNILISKGGSYKNYVSDSVTHVIGDDPEHPTVIDGELYDKVAVTSQWVILSDQSNVQLPLEPFHTDKKNKLFQKLVFTFSNCLSEDDKSRLWAFVTYHGGQFQRNLTEKCTHLITTKCKGNKYDKACSLQSNLKIISPDWLTDSIEQGKRCDENLYHPKYLITAEYLQMRKEREERLRIEEERKKLEEEARKVEMEKKRIEDEKRRNEEKKRIEEERKKLIDEERKKMQEEAIKKQQEEEAIKKQQQEEASKKQQTATTNLVQNKLSSNVNNSSTVQNSSSISSQHLTTNNTVSAISTQTTNNSINVPATQLTLRTVSFPSTSLVSNISAPQNVQQQQQQQQQPTTSPSIGGTPKFKLLVPTNHQIRMSPQSTISTTMNTTNLIQTSPNQNVQPQQQIKSHILTPHTSSMTIQQGQSIQYSTGQTNLNNQNQYQQTVNMNQTGQMQQQNIQQHQITGHPQQITISQPTQAITIQQQQQTGASRSGPVYLVQPRQSGQPQFNFIQIRPPQYLPNQQQQQQQQSQQIRPGQQQQQIRSIQPSQLNNQAGNMNTQTAQIIQNQPITISSSPNTVQNTNKSINVSTNELVPNTQVHKATNIILQQRVQPPVQLQAQQNQQQQQQQQHQNIQQQNLQPMIIQQQQPNQMTANSQLNQTNQPQSIQVVPAQQFIQIQRPVHQINQQQIIRGQNSQQIIFQSANSLQQNGPRQLQTMPQGAIFQQQSPNQNQVQRLQQVRMPQNNNIQTQPTRVATVSSIHPQQTTQLTQQQANINQKPQRFLIKSPPQYIQQGTPTSMVTIRTPIQQQPNQMQTSPMHSNQSKPMISSTSPQQQINQQQIVNKFNPNQPNQIRQQWTNDQQQQQQQQIIRTNGPTQQGQHMQMQLAPGQVIVHNQHSTQQIPQQTTMILQGPPQQIQTTQQWSNQSNLNNQNIQTMVQVRPQQQNVQMMNIQQPQPPQQQQQQPQTIRVIQHQPTTPTQQPVNRLLQSPQGAMKTTPTLISHQIPIITDHNVSNQVRVEQVNCMLQNVNADQATLANAASNVNAKSKLASYLMKNRLKNNSNNSCNSSNNKKDNNSLNKIEVTNKAVDNLRSLDGCSPSSSNSSVSSILAQNNQSSSVAECSNLEPEVIVDKYYSFDSKISVPLDICLIGCVFYLVEYEDGLFKLDDDKRKSVEKNILKHGGQLVNEYSSKVTHVICESYLNQHVQKALKENKRCVTVFWLDDVLEDKKMRYPYKPWHLPRKFDLSSSPCKNKIISISNFNSNERNRICEIINLAGGNCTSYMTDKNTLLICKKFEGKKFRKAIEWGINVVNHYWLQDLWFDKLRDEIDKRYTVCEDKDSLDLDYKLTKELMIGWRTSLKLNEQDHKRLNEFKETSNSKNWKKPDLMSTVLTSKENLIESSNASISLSSNLKSTLAENNKTNSNSINNQNSSLLNDASQTDSQPITSSTLAISNQTDTLTTISTTGNSINNSSTTISTTLSIIKTENSLSPSLTFQKLENSNELSIKKEKVDDEFQIEENKVPTNDVQKSDELMDVDCVPKDSNDLNAINESSNQPQTLIINNVESNLLDTSTTTQSTITKPSLIEIKPTEELNEGTKENNGCGNSVEFKDTIHDLNNDDQGGKIVTVVCTTPTIVTTANYGSNENLKMNNIDECVANKLTKSKLENEIDLPSPKRLKSETSEENDKMEVDQPYLTASKDEKSKEESSQNPSVNGDLHNHLDKDEANENKDTNNLGTQQDQLNEKLKSKRLSDIRILFTNVANLKELTEIAISLGGKVVSQYSECTHLITSKVDRTVKFVCAFNYAHYIMDPSWLTSSKEQGFFLKESDHFLVDKSNEEHFGFRIDESFERRNKRDKPLFARMVFYLTKSCIPSCKILRELIKSAGGIAVINKAPSEQQIDNLKSIGQTFVVISCEKDLYLCDLFFEKEIPVLHPEFVLSNILKQKIEYEPYLID